MIKDLKAFKRGTDCERVKVFGAETGLVVVLM